MGKAVELSAINMNISNGQNDFVLRTHGGGGTGGGLVERLRWKSSNSTLLFNGTYNAFQSIAVDRMATAATAGHSFYLISGGAYTGGTDLAGGDLYLSSGISTGAASSNLYLQTASGSSSGTTDNAPATRMTILGNGNVGIGMSPTMKLDVSGTTRTQSFAGKTRSFSTNSVTLDATDYFVLSTYTGSSNTTITMPSPSAVGAGHTIIIRGNNVGSGNLTIQSATGNQIVDTATNAAAATINVDKNSGASFISDGTLWYRIY